ncbi:hypothetical protein [Schaalia vaccimaxillae]|uniref:hypothetical protein n=1 Tax=Schaalia vaccimaxillae TaxID=183916 RepID=UPI0003B3CEC8|nr:hypothetical protein [Schaalia vaccimaxillae]
MPATTAKYKIPYPVAGDKVSAYPTTAKQAAEKIEETIGSVPNLAFTADAGFTASITSVLAVGSLRIATLQISRKTSAGYQSGYHWRIGTIGNAADRPAARHFGHIMSTADPYLYIDPNGEIHMQFWSGGTWGTGTWDGQIMWAVN